MSIGWTLLNVAMSCVAFLLIAGITGFGIEQWRLWALWGAAWFWHFLGGLEQVIRA